MHKNFKTAEIIMSALPYIQKFSGKIFVIKYGGAAQTNDELKKEFAKDMALLQIVGIKVIIVHGGGRRINETLDKMGIKSEFKDGFRITDKESMEVVEMVLSGLVNSDITALLNEIGAKALGLSGVDGGLFKATSCDGGKYGFVGEIKEVNSDVIYKILDDGFIPVIAPIALGDDTKRYNINADCCASAVAKALNASKVIFLTDTKGVLDKNQNLISKLDKNLIDELKQNQTIIGGMIPKINSCLECINSGVEAAHIIDGRLVHSVLLELFTDEGIGSVIR